MIILCRAGINDNTVQGRVNYKTVPGRENDNTSAGEGKINCVKAVNTEPKLC